jgi:hypothetical protein
MLAALALITLQVKAGPGPAESEDARAPGAAAALAIVPAGSIVAFMPRMDGGDYSDMAGLQRWLDRQGWAICDGSGGTPDLRNRMLLGTTELGTIGQRLGDWDHDHRVRGDTDAPVRRNRSTPTGRQQLRQIPDDQHRHRLDVTTDKVRHLPPSMTVLFIMKVR